MIRKASRIAIGIATRRWCIATRITQTCTIATGTSTRTERGALGQGPWIVVPGVRLAGDAKDDQARTVTPPEAVRLGATHLVVGRPITRAADPAVVYQQILGSI